MAPVSWKRMAEGIKNVKNRLDRAAAALGGSGVKYAVIGDDAVAAWVLDLDEFWSPLLAKIAAARDFDPREFCVVADVIAELLQHGYSNRARQLIELPLAELRRHAFRRWRGLLEAAKSEGLRFRLAVSVTHEWRAENQGVADSDPPCQ